jgi:DNA polymerase elongation subunit (family B)
LICDVRDNRDKFSLLRILCFDIECNISEKEGHFPDAKIDSVIQIGAMVSNYGKFLRSPQDELSQLDEGQRIPFIRTIFTLGSCAPIPGTQVQSFEDEKDMLMAWHKFFMEVDPDIVTGYNITQFDIHYLLERASVLKLDQFPYTGRIKCRSTASYIQTSHGLMLLGVLSQRYDFSRGRPKFSSCPGYEGRLLLDVYHHLREYHQGIQGEGAYKLNNISHRFLNEKKEDIDYKEIPKLQNGDAESRKSIGIYCLKVRVHGRV